ncbi:MAG TPA: aspartate aminotransferase family protein, partial [Micromonosporaceae bacterium]
MEQPDWATALTRACDHALAYLTVLPDRPVGTATTRSDLLAALGGPVPEAPADPAQVVATLAEA